jgi:hypothetical protein
MSSSSCSSSSSLVSSDGNSSEKSSAAESGMGLSSGEREAGFTVGLTVDLMIWSIKDCLVGETFWPSCEPKSC